MQDIPYFMSNTKWFYFNGERFTLTEIAPEAAQKSLVEFYKKEKEFINGKQHKDNKRQHTHGVIKS